MRATRPAKKGETLEVRLPHTVKTAFMAHCRGEGLTASETVRRLIEGEMTRPPPPHAFGLRAWRLLAAALAGLAVGAVAAPSLAHSVGACAPAAGVARVAPG